MNGSAVLRVGLVLLLHKEAGVVVNADKDGEDDEESHQNTAHKDAPAAQAPTRTSCTQQISLLYLQHVQ